MAVLYGLLSEKDLYASRVTEIGFEKVVGSLEMTVAEHNRQLDALFGLFVRRTTQFKQRFTTPAAARLQPLDSAGRALPIKPAGQYDVAYPLQMAGVAWGFDYVTGELMTVQEAADATTTLVDADIRWMRDHLLAALFVDGSWTFTDPLHGALTIKGMASGDTDTYNLLTGGDVGATDDHVLGVASITASTFTTIRDELKEHPENAGEVVVFVPTASRSTVEGLSGFYEKNDPNLLLGTGQTRLIGTLNVPVPGEVFGYIEGCWVVEWRSMPANYLIGVMTGGERPLALREDAVASLRGFKEVARRENHPWYERQFLRRAGFGAWNRVGAVVVRTDSTSYAVPSGYGSPMG